jgi:hypothetical protein
MNGSPSVLHGTILIGWRIVQEARTLKVSEVGFLDTIAAKAKAYSA